MAQATIRNPSHLKDILKVISELTPECRIALGNGMMRISMMEVSAAAHIVYEHKSCDVPEEFTVDVQLAHVLQALNKVTKDNEVTISAAGELLVIEYQKPRYTKHQIPLLDELKILGTEPKADAFQTLTLTSAKELQSAIEEASQIGTEALLVSTTAALTVKAKAEAGARSCEVTLEAKEHNSKHDCESLYAVSYLETMTSVAKLYESVIVRFARDYPVEISFTDKDSYLRFILAPQDEDVVR